ncbi:MAG: hypothetical protein ACW986_08915 [Promethearchaeota archaeon]|jgi:hypothetical protein
MEKNIIIEKATSEDAEILAKLSRKAFHTDSVFLYKIGGFRLRLVSMIC